MSVQQMSTAFANTFLLSEGDRQVLRADRRPEDLRKKRAHRKSRNGCFGCKARKVKVGPSPFTDLSNMFCFRNRPILTNQKCDEKLPCGNCVKRREKCLSNSKRSDSDEPISIRPPLSPLPQDSKVNLLHIELFHHFVQNTIATLAFEPIWSSMIQVSFQVRATKHSLQIYFGPALQSSSFARFLKVFPLYSRQITF
jgi:hypothetical protein